METCASTNHWEILKISSEHNYVPLKYILNTFSTECFHMCINIVEGSSEMLVNLCILGIII